MPITSSWIRPLALAALMFAGGTAQAALITYGTQAAFVAATAARGVDGYDGFSVTSSTLSPITRTAGAYTYRAAASTSTFYGAGTPANPWLSTNLATDSILFDNFSSGVTAIGGNFFGSDINGAFLAGDILLQAIDSEGTVSQTLVNAQTSTFFGFTTNASLVSLRVSAIQPGLEPLWPTIDNLTLGTAAVPEPATVALVALGLLAAAGTRRRS